MTKFLKFLGLGAERKAPAVEADVHPTEGEILAEFVARKLAGKRGALSWSVDRAFNAKYGVDVVVTVDLQGDEALRFLRRFDAIRECQATSTGS